MYPIQGGDLRGKEISQAWRYRRPEGDVNSKKEVPKARRRSREKRADLKVK